MTILETFVLVGTILSHDTYFSTVQFELNPALEGQAAIAVLPNNAIPCEVTPGRKIYVIKEKQQEYPVISCALEKQ